MECRLAHQLYVDIQNLGVKSASLIKAEFFPSRQAGVQSPFLTRVSRFTVPGLS